MRLSINRRREDVGSLIRRAGDGDYHVVVAPDHPLVMRSVDVLVGGRFGLTAIMMSTVEEMRRPELFRSRLKLNVAALPAHANFIYLGDEREIQPPDASFAATLSFAERGSLEALPRLVARLDSQRSRRREDAWEKAEARFADTYRLARYLQRGGKERGQSGRRTSRAPARDRIKNDIEALFFSGSPTPSAIAKVTLEGAERWYSMNDGVFSPIAMPAGAAFIEDIPQVRGDPDKVIRAAAFAGWVVTPIISKWSRDQVGDFVSRYTRLK